MSYLCRFFRNSEVNAYLAYLFIGYDKQVVYAIFMHCSKITIQINVPGFNSFFNFWYL